MRQSCKAFVMLALLVSVKEPGIGAISVPQRAGERSSGSFAARVSAEIHAFVDKSGADVAVAFRTLDGRDELLIQPVVVFHAASTMKVPVLIELFRQAKTGRLSLDDQILVVNRFRSIVDGSPYSLDTGDNSDAEVYKHLGGRLSY